MPSPDPRELTAWLISPAAGPALAAAAHAAEAHRDDPLAAAASLRRQQPDLSPDRAAAVLEQASLRRRARELYGVDGDLLLTRDGLEAATRPEVAAHRARALASAGVRHVVDATAGLGFDARAFVAAGLSVTAIERDDTTAAFLRHNCPGAVVVAGDAADVLASVLAELRREDVVFVDPARRDPGAGRDARTGRARPERDPELWSPPWSWVEGIRHPRVLAKVSPGFRPPDDWWAEWVSVDRVVVECGVASWPIHASRRRAVVLRDGDESELAVRPEAVGARSAPQGWLFEPDPAVVRAGALDTLADDLGLARLDEESTWLTGSTPVRSPMLRGFEVIAELDGSARQQRRQLALAGISRVSVKSRDVPVDIRSVLRELGVTEGMDGVVILTRHAGRTVSLLARSAAPTGH